MNHIKIEVPSGIKYISEWTSYTLPSNKHCIVDKGVTGCGYTEFCLTNNQNIVLCSPRKLLLENKQDQHFSDPNIMYFLPENAQKDSTIKSHIKKCSSLNLPVKFMVTYDSLHYIVDYLKDSTKDYTFIVDEFQSIFLDSFFKSDVEMDFVTTLQHCQNVIYLSATPMLDKYLQKLPQFNNLDFYILDWSKSEYVEKVVLQRKQVYSLGKACDNIINAYLSENYETVYTDHLIYSKEAVLYFNSVSDIIRIINRHPGLSPENTLVICAQTSDNTKRLKRIGFKIGKIPLKDEPNPMFTFCTSASYMGVDFYSDCASTYIFADPNIKSLALDVSLDLPQIVGRQRNRNNPFKNNITIFYKTTRGIISKSDFTKEQLKKKKESQIILDTFSKMDVEAQAVYLKKLKDSIKVSQYSEDFISISKITNLPVYNPLIEISNERAYEISQEDYQDSINVTKALETVGFKSDSNFLDKFNSLTTFKSKLQFYCEYSDKHPGLYLKLSDPCFHKYYSYYGTAGCAAHKYLKKSLEKDFKQIDTLEARIKSKFIPGMRMTRETIKVKLQQIYDSLNLNKKAKATDLNKYFQLIRTTVNSTGGFKIGTAL